MSLEATIQENTNAIKALIKTITNAPPASISQVVVEASKLASDSQAADALSNRSRLSIVNKASDALAEEAKAIDAAKPKTMMMQKAEADLKATKARIVEEAKSADVLAESEGTATDAAPEEPEQTLTIEAVRASLIAVKDKLGKKAAREILDEHGVKVVTQLREADYDKFKAICDEALEGVQ